jgi:hypothetical protein
MIKDKPEEVKITTVYIPIKRMIDSFDGSPMCIDSRLGKCPFYRLGGRFDRCSALDDTYQIKDYTPHKDCPVWSVDAIQLKDSENDPL